MSVQDASAGKSGPVAGRHDRGDSVPAPWAGFGAQLQRAALDLDHRARCRATGTALVGGLGRGVRRRTPRRVRRGSRRGTPSSWGGCGCCGAEGRRQGQEAGCDGDGLDRPGTAVGRGGRRHDHGGDADDRPVRTGLHEPAGLHGHLTTTWGGLREVRDFQERIRAARADAGACVLGPGRTRSRPGRAGARSGRGDGRYRGPASQAPFEHARPGAVAVRRGDVAHGGEDVAVQAQ